MSTLTSPQYPFDPTGTKATNRVIGELQPLTGVGDRDYYIVVPKAAPFFIENFAIAVRDLQGNIVPLVEGVDFYFTHYFIGASLSTGKPVYGSITMLNTQLRGTLIFQPYQTVGGDWTVDSNQIAKILASQAYNPRTISWEVVANQPNIFPPTKHEWNLQDMVGQKEVVAALNRVVDAILARMSDAMSEHIHDMTPQAHGITATSIGAVTREQLDATVQAQVEKASATSDGIKEGDTNKFYTEQRVMLGKLVGYLVSQEVENLSEQDSVLKALQKLQAQLVAARKALDEKANLNRPHFTGLGSQGLVKLALTTNSLSVPLIQSEAFQIRIQSNGSIGFDTRGLGDMTDRLIEFAITTINDGTSNKYAVAWPSNVRWVEGKPPPRSTDANAKDSWYFWSEDGGASWTGSLSNKNPY